METIKVEILDPKAIKLLNNLADLKLIKINRTENDFTKLVKKIRNNSTEEISLKEISKEVETVRHSRNAK